MKVAPYRFFWAGCHSHVVVGGPQVHRPRQERDGDAQRPHGPRRTVRTVFRLCAVTVWGQYRRALGDLGEMALNQAGGPRFGDRSTPTGCARGCGCCTSTQWTAKRRRQTLSGTPPRTSTPPANDAFTAAGFRISVISEPHPVPEARELFPDELADMPTFLCFLFFVLHAG